MFYLTKYIDRSVTEDHDRAAAQKFLTSDVFFRQSLLANPLLSPYLSWHLDELLSPEGYLGLAKEQLDAEKIYFGKKAKI